MLDCVGVVMKKLSLSYKEALAQISKDKENFKEVTPALTQPPTPVFNIVESEMDYAYWDKYKIPHNIVRAYAVQARTVYRNEEYYARSTKSNPIFVYKFKSGNIKMYRPLSPDPLKK